MRKSIGTALTALGLLLASAAAVQAQPAATAPRGEDVIPQRAFGVGPFSRTVLRNVMMIDGTGAPAQGPVDIVLSGNRIAEIRSIGVPGAIDQRARAAAGDHELDLTGHYVMPGFVDAHVHLHNTQDEQGVPADYILKLWLASGITSVREVGSSRPIEWLTAIKARSARNEIVAPRIDVYPFFHRIRNTPVNDVASARAAVNEAKKRGADGIKFIGGPEDVLMAAIAEAKKIGLHTTMHHAQGVVAYANVLATTEAGLESMEHWYGLPEAMFTNQRLQSWPGDFVNSDEQQRFGQAGRLWAQAAEPGSDKWNVVMETLLERGFTINPTFTAYLASRDLMRMSRATWHDEYTHPALWEFYRPSRTHHGSYWFDWTTEDEMAWKDNFRRWMTFVNEYKNRGGRVTVGSDAGYIYNLYGFGYAQEMELLREAGFSSLEVIRAATQEGARLLGHEDEVGTLRVGRKADLVVVKGNPLANMKLLFGTGTLRLNDETGKAERVGGIAWTIKDGILYDAKLLRADIRRIVAEAKAQSGVKPGAMAVETLDLTR